MRITQFLSRVNLDRFLKTQEINDFTCYRHPYLGWVAYTKQGGEYAGCLLDLIDSSIWPKLYEYVTKKHPNCLDVSMLYNEKAEKAFQENLLEFSLWTNLLKLCQHDMTEIVSNWNTPGVPFTHKCTFRDYLITQGCKGCPDNGFGSISSSIVQTYADIRWPKGYEYRRKLIVPSWTAPGMLFSIEACHPESPEEREILYRMDPTIPMGWYGDLTSPVVDNLNDMTSRKGLVWSRHVEPFIKHLVVINPSTSHETCFKLWCTAGLDFAKAPTQDCEERLAATFVDSNLYKLTKRQLDTLERNMGQSFVNDWLSSKKDCCVIGNDVFEKRADGYYEVRSTGDIKITDFTLDLIKVDIDRNYSITQIEMLKDGVFYTLNFPYSTFKKGTFVFKFKERAMTHGISKLYVNPKYETMLSTLVQEFWPEVPVSKLNRKKAKDI